MAASQALADLKTQREAIEGRLAALKAERSQPREEIQLAEQIVQLDARSAADEVAADVKIATALRDGYTALLGEMFQRVEMLDALANEAAKVFNAYDEVADRIRGKGHVPAVAVCRLPVFGTSADSLRALFGLLQTFGDLRPLA